MMTNRPMLVFAVLAAAICTWTAPAAADGTTPVDPCLLANQQNVAQALDTSVQTVGKPQHPTPTECVWTVASRTGGPTTSVVLSVENANQARKCHGLGCITAVQSVVNQIPGVPYQFNDAVNAGMTGAQTVQGIGQRAGWKNGALTVIQNQQAFRVEVNNGATDPTRLAESETIARDAVARLPDASGSTPMPSASPAASPQPSPTATAKR